MSSHAVKSCAKYGKRTPHDAKANFGSASIEPLTENSIPDDTGEP